MDARALTPAQLDHLLGITQEVCRRIGDQYTKGAVEHGGDMRRQWTASDLLEHAISETVDMLVYLLTLKEKTERTAEESPDDHGQMDLPFGAV